VTQSFPGELESPASPQRKRNDGEREVARKNAAICKRETSTFLSLSSYTCLEESQWKDYLIPILGQRRATRRYMRRSGSMTSQTGVKEWLDGGKKRHAQALVWCTWVTQIRYGWVGSPLS